MTLDKAFELLSELEIKDKKVNEALEFIEDLAEGFYYAQKMLGLGEEFQEKRFYIRRNDTPTNSWVKTWYDAKGDFETIKRACNHCLESDDEELEDRHKEWAHKANLENIHEYGYPLSKEFLERSDEEDYKINCGM